MSNSYVPDLIQVSPGDLARSADVNDRYDATIAGFDRLPEPKNGEKGFSAAVPVGTPVNNDHAVTKLWAETAMTSQLSIAITQANNASNSAAAALVSENNASTSETNAGTSETNANTYAGYANEWAVNPEDALISIAAGGNGTTDYSSLHFANKASASATAASTSEGNAATSETNAAISETNAGISAANAATSESNANDSANHAQEWAITLEDTLVSVAAGGNGTSDYSALHHASKAAASAQAASLSEGNAATSESNAATSAGNASTSETNASTSETNASNSAAYSQEWAAKAEDTLVSVAAGGNGITDYSALHHAAKAASSASAASTSEGNAATSESNAATSAANAAISESNAATSASNANASAIAAQASLDAMEGTYLGAQASDPTLDLNGDPVTAGDWYFNTTNNAPTIYSGSAWITVSASVPDQTGNTGNFLTTNGVVSSWKGITESDITDLKTYLTAHPSISGAPSVNNSGNTFVQDLTIDPDGHITGVISGTASFTDTDTTYSVSAVTTTGGAFVRLTAGGSGSGTDDVKLASGGATTVSFTDANTITISSTDTTYTSSNFNHDDLTGYVANEHIDWTVDQGATNIHANNYTNTTYVSSDFNHDDLTGFVANEHIDWTVDQGATNIHSGNYTNTTYSTNTAYGTSMSGTQIRLNGGEIAASVDLNGMRTQGVFCQNSNADAGTGSNYPVALAGILRVDNDMYGNGLFTVQTYHVYNDQRVYTRHYYNGSWTAWRDLSANTNTTYTNGTGLGLSGTTFSVNYGTTSTTACVGNDTRLSDSRQCNNSFDNAATARTNLGLGSLATLSSVNASTIADNSVGAAELNVTGNGTTSQYLRSDGDGTFTWATPPDTDTWNANSQTVAGYVAAPSVSGIYKVWGTDDSGNPAWRDGAFRNLTTTWSAPLGVSGANAYFRAIGSYLGDATSITAVSNEFWSVVVPNYAGSASVNLDVYDYTSPTGWVAQSAQDNRIAIATFTIYYQYTGAFVLNWSAPSGAFSSDPSPLFMNSTIPSIIDGPAMATFGVQWENTRGGVSPIPAITRIFLIENRAI